MTKFNHIQIKRGDGSPISKQNLFLIGELGYDLTNNDLYIKTQEGSMIRIGSNIVSEAISDSENVNSNAPITSLGVAKIKEELIQADNNLQQTINTDLDAIKERLERLETFKTSVENGDTSVLVEQ